MTFSIIVPIYNVEKYLAKCIDSLLAQTFSDFEILLINDGSPDNSQAIIDHYAAQYPHKIKAFLKENGGLSDARNFGIARAGGEYLLFVDSDDYLAPDSLELLHREIQQNTPDIVGFHMVRVDESGATLSVMNRPILHKVSGEDAIIALTQIDHCFETACSYAYRRSFWLENNFAFTTGIYHEDYALIPYVILKAASVSCIDHNVYYYVSTDNSITRTLSDQRTRKLAEDLLKGYDGLMAAIRQNPPKRGLAEKAFLSYISYSVIYRLVALTGETKDWFRQEAIRRNVVDHLYCDTLRKKIRKIRLRIKHRI